MTTQTSSIGSSARSGLWRAAGIALILAIVINEALRLAAVALLGINPGFLPLTATGPVIMFTAIGVLGATLVYWITTRLSKNPGQLFRTIAWVVLGLSFVPNILTGLNPQSAPFPGVTWAAIITLMVLHLPPALLSIFLLPRKS
jgi:hypothetical protein